MQKIFNIKSQIIHFAGVPLVFLAMILLYRPERTAELLDMGSGWFDFNIVILFCILLVLLVITRFSLFFLKDQIKGFSGLSYAGWCVGEILIFNAFAAMYLCLMYRGQIPYFPMLARCVLYFGEILFWPYLVIGLYLRLEEAVEAANAKPVEEDDMVRFQDENQKLKLAVTAQSLLFIEAKENYVNVVYLDGTTIRKYLLRSSMKRLEEMLRTHGLRRCQRAYYVNPVHITVLRKDSDGFYFADLDVAGCPPIPVSKTYYDEIASLL